MENIDYRTFMFKYSFLLKIYQQIILEKYNTIVTKKREHYPDYYFIVKKFISKCYNKNNNEVRELFLKTFGIELSNKCEKLLKPDIKDVFPSESRLIKCSLSEQKEIHKIWRNKINNLNQEYPNLNLDIDSYVFEYAICEILTMSDDLKNLDLANIVKHANRIITFREINNLKKVKNTYNFIKAILLADKFKNSKQIKIA